MNTVFIRNKHYEKYLLYLLLITEIKFRNFEINSSKFFIIMTFKKIYQTRVKSYLLHLVCLIFVVNYYLFPTTNKTKYRSIALTQFSCKVLLTFGRIFFLLYKTYICNFSNNIKLKKRR